MILYIWPDGTWCDEDELQGELHYKSDDYRKAEVSDDWDYELIDAWVAEQ